jgi:hypothetical protein
LTASEKRVRYNDQSFIVHAPSFKKSHRLTMSRGGKYIEVANNGCAAPFKDSVKPSVIVPVKPTQEAKI